MKKLHSIFNIHYSKSGFTLIETLVAIVVLLLAIVGPYQIATRGLFAAGIAKDQITAYYLAQEPVEYIRNIRDHNGLLGNPSGWLDGLDECLGQNCYVDVFNQSIQVCLPEGCPVLKYDNSVSGSYTYNYGANGETSPFTRTTTMTQINANEYSISVSVTWSRGLITRDFTIRENIFNWQ